ncbi:MAG: DUF2231 domain-containing protein [Longimicrobiales bacterium]
MLPDIGFFHPHVVHFAISLLIVGVVFRVLWITGKLPFMGPGATTLLLAGTLAAVLAVQSGTDAHGPVERVPGARKAVQEHEEWGERARNIFLGVSALEILAILLASRTAHTSLAKGLRVASAVVGLAGVGALYEAGEHGGELVYNYAGGIGIRSGEAVDIQNTLVAGLYHTAMAARKAGRPDEAARMIDELARQRPQDADIKVLHIESILRDRRDAPGALAALAAEPPSADPRMNSRLGVLRADAYVLAGQRDSARAVIEALIQASPDNLRLKAKLDSLK